ncbi:MAG TPA: PQQ-binding-like beta-propeller repeat protein [Pyrinomonadaceae bacterium]|jgi:outer membrane protein assembly factor BamB|nr:PQQ-binding-like beta-propeller repeat protein [Pyrinomonadaceae bacterium]
MKVLALLLCLLCLFTSLSQAQPVWQANLDGKVQFYQTTDFGIVLAGSENSLLALDGQTGERLWRKKTRSLDETSVTPIPSTDLILISSDEGDKSRVEAVDLLSGETLWRSDKVKGDVMQLAVEPQNDLLAVVLVKKAKGKTGEEFKRTPVVHVFRLSNGDELWKKELESDVQMMPSRFDTDAEVAYTLDNYRAPLILDGRVYLFYEGVTSYDAESGKEGERERFKVNEGGLALTEADVVFDEKYLYTSGRGKVRAVNRNSNKVEWEAKDLGVTPEMAVVGNVLYVRTGGQFTRIKDGEIEEEGSFGVSAIDTKNGKTLWRYKGADKGLTNFVFADAGTILVADRDDLITIDARTGKKIGEFEHDVEKAQFVLINEKGEAVVGGRDEIAAFQIQNSKFRAQSDYKLQTTDFKLQNSLTEIQNPETKDQKPNELWRVKHKAPSRGVFRIVAGIALRAAAIYFRYGGLATSALNIVRGANVARSVLSLRWSGLRSRFSSFDLTTLAANSARNYVTNQITAFGIASRSVNLLNRVEGLQVVTPNSIRGKIISGAIQKATPSRADVQESLLDRIDPVRQVEKLSNYFLRRKRLADLRGNYMYFYTDLPKPFDKKGLVGVNVNTGRDSRFILVSEPDARFTTDETIGLLYSADGSTLKAFDVMER